MSFVKWVRDGIAHPRVAIYLKVMAGPDAPECLVPFREHYGHHGRLLGGQALALPNSRPAVAAHQFGYGLGILEDHVLGGGRLAGSGCTLSGSSVLVLR